MLQVETPCNMVQCPLGWRWTSIGLCFDTHLINADDVAIVGVRWERVDTKTASGRRHNLTPGQWCRECLPGTNMKRWIYKV